MPQGKKSAASEEGTKPARRTRSTQKYIRNLYGVPLSLKVIGQRHTLRPRGQRGDLIPVTKEQLADFSVSSNVGVTVEVIGEVEAQKILAAQTTNQQAYHPALKALRTEYGKEYEQTDVELTLTPDDEGETVAVLDNGQIATEFIPGKGHQIVREPKPKPRSVGPRIATDVPGSEPEFAELYGADEAARNGDSLTDVLGGFNVER